MPNHLKIFKNKFKTSIRKQLLMGNVILELCSHRWHQGAIGADQSAQRILKTNNVLQFSAWNKKILFLMQKTSKCSIYGNLYIYVNSFMLYPFSISGQGGWIWFPL